MRKPTIYEALAAKLGRVPTDEELRADMKRITDEVLVELAVKGRLISPERPARGAEKGKGAVVHYDSKTWKQSAGGTVPDWWAPVVAREQAEREAELRTERVEAMRRARNEAVLEVLRQRGR